MDRATLTFHDCARDRRSGRRAALGALLLPIAWAAAAAADEPRPLADRQVFLRVDGGLFSAVGFGGASVGYSPHELFAVELGVGYGYTGAQLSLMPKLQVGSDANRFVLGLGVSVCFDSGDYKYKEVPWLNLDLGYEHRWSFGLSFSVAVGVTVSLIDFDPDIGGDGFEIRETKVAPQARMGLGYWF